jgi:phosphatidylinositol-3-phosphatase
LPAFVVIAALTLAGCGGTHSASSTAPTPSATSATPAPSQSAPQGSTSTTSATRSAAQTGISKLLVFVVENHSLDEMRTQMPWTYRLAERYGYAASYRALSHPSLPNYLAIAGGSTFGVHDDLDPSAHPISGPSVFGAALRAGLTAKVYGDSMPAPCSLTNEGEYAVRHNPWTYFVDERGACRTFDLPLSRYQADASSGHLPDAGMVVPDICHDAHDCSLATADAWLQQEVGLAMSGPDFREGRLAVVITADEDDGSQANTVLTVVVHPSLHGTVSHAPLSHLSLCRLYAQVLGVPPLHGTASAPSMATAFHLRLARG